MTSYTYYRLTYYTWDPPELTIDEKVALGQKISLEGREVFRRNFWARTAGSAVHSKPNAGHWIIAIIFLIGIIVGLIYFDLWKRLIAPLIAGMILLLGSRWLVNRKIDKWVDTLVSAYAIHALEEQRAILAAGLRPVQRDPVSGPSPTPRPKNGHTSDASVLTPDQAAEVLSRLGGYIVVPDGDDWKVNGFGFTSEALIKLAMKGKV